MSKKQHWVPFLIAAVLVVGLYFGSDLLIKVRALNELTTPYPIAGTVLAAGVAWLLWVVVIGPIISFCRMGRGAGSVESRTRAALRELEPYEHCENDPDPRKRELFALWRAIYNAHLKEPKRLPELLARYAENSELHRRAIQYVSSSCRATAIGVVISRNKFLDGLVLLVLQMKMIVALARMHGYKPSLVFNLLCFSWVIANSIIFSLISANAVEAAQGAVDGHVIDPAVDALQENVFEPLAQYIGEQSGIEVLSRGLGGIVPGFGGLLSASGKILFEAVLGALPVYVTGRVFLMRLEGDASAVDMKTLVNIRREGLKNMWEIWGAKGSFQKEG
ncbi:MAG: hypothetical protein MJ058_08385 [Akkermansia sp.]|nr:hypothetical protein [Akkermansia sp.]